MRRVIAECFLVAEDSARKAFYSLYVEELETGFLIRKVSGANGKILHEENYWRPDITSSLTFLEDKVASKTDPARKGPRKYRLIHQTRAAQAVRTESLAAK